MNDPMESEELNQDQLSDVQGAAPHGGTVCPAVANKRFTPGKLSREDPKLDIKRRGAKPE